MTYTGTTKGFGRVLAGDKPLASQASWKNRAQAMIVLGFEYLPDRKKVSSAREPAGNCGGKGEG